MRATRPQAAKTASISMSRRRNGPPSRSIPCSSGFTGSRRVARKSARNSPTRRAYDKIADDSRNFRRGDGRRRKARRGSATAYFHAESLSTLALDDLRLITASRSATRDIVWTLAPVEGLAKPPRYRGRLFVEISIQVCDENPCTVISGDSDRGSR